VIRSIRLPKTSCLLHARSSKLVMQIRFRLPWQEPSSQARVSQKEHWVMLFNSCRSRRILVLWRRAAAPLRAVPPSARCTLGTRCPRPRPASCGAVAEPNF
jgi:hypothetical protein